MRRPKKEPGIFSVSKNEKPIISPDIPQENVLSLRKRILSIQINLDKVHSFFKDNKKSLGIIVGVIAGLIITVGAFKTSAQLATFYPANCLGGWENPAGAEGEPNVKDATDPASFTNTNSAVLKNTNGELFCGNFQGEIPQDSLPKKFTIKLNWSIDDGTVVHTKENPVEIIQQPETPGDSSSGSSDTGNGTDSSNPETPPAESVTPPADTPPDSPPVDVTPAPDATSPTEPDATPPDTTSPDVVPDTTTPETDTSPASDTAPASSSDTTPVSFLEKTFIPVAHAEDIPAITTDEGAGIIPIDSGAHTDDFFEVRYTLDGTNWKSLGMVSKANWQNAEFEISDPSITSWDDLSKLQVSLRTISTIDTLPIIYVDSISFEVEYENITAVPVPPTVLLKDTSSVIEGDADFSADDSPVFTVTDPGLTTEDINQLVKDNKAEIVEDKGSVLDASNDSESSPGNPLPTPGEIINSLKENLMPVLDTKDIPVPDAPKKSDVEVLPVPDTMEDTPSSGTEGTVPDTTTETQKDSFNFHPSHIAMKDFSPLPYFKKTRAAFSQKSAPNILNAFMTKEALADVVPENDVTARVLDFGGDPTDIPVSITTVTINGTSHPQITIAKPEREFRPGKYTLEVTLTTPQAVIVSKQDFSWGVLAINTDKSIYKTGDTAYLQMGVLNDQGHTICDAKLALSITGPTGTVSNFNTNNNSIVSDSSCAPDNVITVPDYYAHFLIPNQAGTYKMTLTATTANGDKTIHDKFEVKQNTDFTVMRTGPTRIYPVAVYPMTLNVTAKNNWSGTITETVPASFEVLHPLHSVDYMDVTVAGDPSSPKTQTKIISWDVTLTAGTTVTLGYKFKAPPISPEFYLLGPIRFADAHSGQASFEEARRWQIASDAVCTSNGSGGGVWSSSGTWSGCSGGGGVPDGTDDVTINGGDTVTMDQDGATNSLTIASGGALNTSNGVSTFTDTHDFTNSGGDGGSPYGNLISVHGVLYGMTSNGGGSSLGMIFSEDPNGSNFTNIHSFAGGSSDGVAPRGSLVYSNGLLYGMTYQGGTSNTGIIFSIKTDGTSFTLLHSFTGGSTDGVNPYGSLILADGLIYGMTYQGGPSNEGIIFSMNIDGTGFTDMHDFNTGSTDGITPYGSLAFSDGVLYGMTYQGGANNYGIAFSINPDGSNFTDIHDFNNSSTDGANPYGDILVSGGVLYGTTTTGGANGYGIIFSMNPDGSSFTDLYDFTGAGAGTSPYGNLIIFNGVLYGMTNTGGASGYGAIFTINTNGSSYTDIFDFNTGAGNGANPYGNLIVSAGRLYGMTQTGGSGGSGITFSLQTSWDLTSGTLDVQSGGTMTANNSTITLNANSGPLMTDGGSGFIPGESTVVMDPNATTTLTSGAIDFYNLYIRHSTGSNHIFTLNSSAINIRNDFNIMTSPFAGGDLTIDLGGDITHTSGTGNGTIFMDSLYKCDLILDTTASNYNIDTDNIFIENHSTESKLVANDSVITVAKDWTLLYTNAKFSYDTSEVHMTSSSTSLIYGDTAFYDLTIDNATAKEVYFYATGGAPTFEVANAFTVTGHVGALIKLYSNIPGTQWDFLPDTTATVDYADVKDGGCHVGAISISPSNSINSGNNGTCWSFGISVSGVVYLSDEVTIATNGNGGDCDNTNNLYLRVNGGSPYTTACSAVDAAYIFTGVVASAGDTITIYGGATNKTNAVVRTDGATNMTGINLYYTVVSLPYSAYSGITPSDMGYYDGSTDATNMLFDSNTILTVNSGVTLQVEPGAGFNLTMDATINHDFTNNGGIITPNGYTITGSGTNTLTNTNAGGSIYVDATTWAGNYASFETVTMATNSFTSYTRAGAQTIDSSFSYGCLLTSGSGTKSLGGNTTATGYLFIISPTTLTTTGSNYSLTVGSIYDIQSGATLTANASTITLTSGPTTAEFGTSSGGTFTAGTSTVIINADVNIPSITNTSSGITFYNLTLSPTITAARAYDFSGSGNITVSNNFTINPTSSGSNLLTVTMGENIAVTGTTTIQRTTSATATLNTNASGNYELDTGFLNIATGGTLVANASFIGLTGSSGTLFTRTGTFTQGTSTVDALTPTSSVTTLLSASTTFHILKIQGATNGTIINAGANITTDNASGNMLWVYGGVFNVEGRTITPGTSSTLQLDSLTTFCLGGTTAGTNTTCDSGATQTSAVSMPTFTTFSFNSGSSVRYLSDAAQTVSQTPTYGNLYLNPKLTSARTYTLGGAMNINGNFDIKPTSSGANLLTVNMGGTVTVASGKTTAIERTTSATANLDTTGTNYALTTGLLEIDSGGTLTANGSTVTLNATSGTLFTLNTGTFTAGTSTVVMNPNAAVTLTSGAITFFNLSLTPTITTGRTYTFGSSALSINGDFNINPTSSGANALTVNMAADITVASTKTTTITRTTSATSLLDTRPSSTDYNLQTGFINIATGGTLDCTSASSSITLTGGSGTLFTQTGTFNTGTSTVTMNQDAAVTLTSGTITFYNLTLSPTITTARTYTFGSSALTINGDFNINPTSSGANALTVNMAAAITVATSKTTTIQRTTSATALLDTRPSSTDYNLSTGNLTISTGGTLDCTSSSSTITVAGNWTNNGTFTQGTSGVTLNSATTATVAGTTTFYDLTITHSAAKEVDFSITSTPIFDVSHTFTVTGHAANLIKLYSTSAGTKWQFHPTGTAVIDYADVKDGGCQAGAITMNATHSTDSGNNDSCWTFGTSISGTVYKSDETTTATTGNGGSCDGTTANLSLRVNGGTAVTTTCSSSTAAYSFTGLTLASGDTVAIYSTAANKANTVFLADGLTHSGVKLYYNVVALSHYNAGPIAISNLTSYDSTTNATDMLFDATVTPSLTANAGVEIHIESGSTFTPGGNVTISNLHLLGTYSAGSTTLTLQGTSGTLFNLNGGTFTYGTSTVSMTPDAAMTLTSGAITFYNLSLTPTITTGRTYTFGSGALTINNNFTVNPTSSGANTLTVNMGANITVTATTTIQRTTSALATLSTTGSNYALSTGKIDIQASGTLTANASTITLTSTSSTLFTLNASGTFTAGTSTVIMNPDAAVTLTSGAITFYNLTLSPSLGAARTYTLGASATTISNNFDINPGGGTFLLTVNMGSGGLNVTGTVTVEATSTATSKLSTVAGYLVQIGYLNITAAGTVDATSSTFRINGSTGTLFTRAGTFTEGTSQIVVGTGTSATFLSAATTLHSLYIDSSGGVINAGANITTDNVAGNGIEVATGSFNTEGRTITPGTSGSLLVDAGATLCLGGTTSATNTTCDSGATQTSAVAMPAFNTFTFNATSTIRYLYDAAETVSQTPTYGNLTLAPKITSGRTYTMGGAMTINGNFTINPTAASALTLTVNMGGAITVGATKTTTIQGTTSGLSNLDSTGTNYNLTTGKLDIESGGTYTAQASTITLNATSGTLFTIGGTGVFTYGTSTVAIGSCTTVTLTSGVIGFYNLSQTSACATTNTETFGAGAITVNNNLSLDPTSTVGSTTTVNMGAAITVTGTTLVRGRGIGPAAITFSTTGSNYALTTGLLDIEANAIFTSNSSVVTLTGTSGTLFTKVGTLTAVGSTSEWDVTSASGTPTILSAATTLHILKINGAATVINIGANLTTDNNSGNKLWIASGILNQENRTLAGGTSAVLQIDSGGTLCLGGTTGATTNTCDSGVTQTVTQAMPSFTTYTFDSASTVKYLSDANTTILQTPTYGNLFFTPKMTSGRTYTLGGAMTINGNFDINPGTAANLLTVNAAGTITVATTKTTTIERTTSATSLLDMRPSATDYDLSTGTLTISAGGTLDLTSASSAITVAGSWTNNGTFTQGTSTVTMNGATTAVVTGTTTFYNFTITHSSAKEVDFATASTPIFHVTNTFTVTGHTGAKIKLYSNSAGTKWQFHPTGTATVDYADVKDGGCQSGAISINPTNSTDSGNNDSCWGFARTLTFAISSSSIGLGTISTSSAATGSETISAATNGPGGLVVTYNGPTLTSGSNTIAAYSALSSSSPGTAGFGINLKANTVPSVGADPTTNSGTCGVATNYNTANSYTWIASTTTSITNVTAPADCVYTVSYVGNINTTTKAGSYSTAITYIVSATF